MNQQLSTAKHTHKLESTGLPHRHPIPSTHTQTHYETALSLVDAQGLVEPRARQQPLPLSMPIHRVDGLISHLHLYLFTHAQGGRYAFVIVKLSTARTLTNPIRRISRRSLRYGFLWPLFSGRYHTERGAQATKNIRGRSTSPFSYTRPPFGQMFLRRRQKVDLERVLCWFEG